MSKPRYVWWSYVKAVIRKYPELALEYKNLHSQAVTQSYSGMPGGGGSGRSLESIAIRELSSTKQREYEAVRRAVEVTERYQNGQCRMKIIRLVMWERSHTLEGAASMIPCSYATAKRYLHAFICRVAKNYGLMDE